MIYDYSKNPPTVINSARANSYFPEFYFHDDIDIYYIYPQVSDKIIYNYSLGAFFKFIRNGEYQNIAIRPITTSEQMGTLIGYTQSSPTQLPTLYYKNGRLTLQHKNCRNIGWHPRKSQYTYVYGNILNPNDPKVFKRGTQFNQQEFDKAIQEATGNTSNEVKLIELYYDNNCIIISRHVSRSKLILGPVSNFELPIVNQFLAVKEINPPPF